MRLVFKKSIAVVAFIFSSLFIFSQHKVMVKAIEFKGLKHTKENVVLQELDFAINDSIDISNISSILEKNEKRLLSIGLFNLCDMNIKQWDEASNSLVVFIDVKENWYIYPAPIFELADRSFNVWWKEMNRSLSRVNYGLRLDHLNLTGNKDKFKIILQSGYTRKYESEYIFPYIYKNWGLRINAVFSENKEIGYINFSNKVLFKKYDDERILLKRFRTGITAVNRLNVYTNQFFKAEYHYNQVNDIVVKDLNPSYFPNGDKFIKYLKLEYVLKYNRTIFPTYPEGGYAFSVEARGEGFGIGNYNNSGLAIDYEKYFNPTKKLILGFKVKGKINFTNNVVPYSNNSAIGYGSDVLRGYELYVMDGTRFAWGKTAVKYNLLDKIYSLGKYMKIGAFKKMSIRLFTKWTTEVGYSYEPTYIASNTFNNRMLIGYGPGLDLLLFNNFVVSAEYNYNHTGQGSIFYKSSFNF
jgi:outer membrane protein assembly factor BamA